MSSAGATHAQAAVAGTHYAVNQRVCAVNTAPHEASCYAMRRVSASKGVTGAYAVGNSVGAGPAGGFTPAQLAKFYGYNASTSRATQTVGIVDWYNDPSIAANLKTFDTKYGLPAETATSFRKVNQNGLASPQPSSALGKGTATEIALDVETVRAVCHTCKILLVEANTPTDANLVTAENTAVRLGATEVSNSFGEPEGKASAAVQAGYNHPGVVITASTGDDGWYGWDVANSGQASPAVPSFPSTSPFVVAVGGTGYNPQQAGAQVQYVWNDNGPDDIDALQAGQKLGAGGGGCSKQYTSPSWQSTYAGYTANKCAGKRLAADVAGLADPQTGFDIYDSYGGTGWMTIGGTSLASPMVAAMYALAGGSGGAAYPATSAYLNAKYHATTVNDITVGGNGFCAGDSAAGCANAMVNYTGGSTNNPNGFGGGIVDCTFPRSGAVATTEPVFDPECNAVKGYDGPSGVGTPKSASLFTSTSPKLSLTPATAKHAVATTYTAKATESLTAAKVASYSFAWGDGTAATSGTAAAAKHTYAKAGSYAITLTVRDNLHQTSILHASVKVS